MNALKKSPKPPKALQALQNWFSQSVFETKSDEAHLYITNSKALNPDERVAIYTQDYWPRLIESLEDDFPTVKEHLKEAFSKTIKEYIATYSSTSFTLFHLGKHFVTFIKETFPEDMALIDAAKYDWAKAYAYFAAEEPVFSPQNLSPDQQEYLAQIELHFQPHVHVLALKKEKQFLVVYRQNYSVKEEAIPELFYHLLVAIQDQHSISKAISHLKETLDEKALSDLEQHTQGWLSHCVECQWLCHPKGEKT